VYIKREARAPRTKNSGVKTLSCLGPGCEKHNVKVECARQEDVKFEIVSLHKEIADFGLLSNCISAPFFGKTSILCNQFLQIGCW
jgi:hypothetical protein